MDRHDRLFLFGLTKDVREVKGFMLQIVEGLQEEIQKSFRVLGG